MGPESPYHPVSRRGGRRPCRRTLYKQGRRLGRILGKKQGARGFPVRPTVLPRRRRVWRGTNLPQQQRRRQRREQRRQRRRGSIRRLSHGLRFENSVQKLERRQLLEPFLLLLPSVRRQGIPRVLCSKGGRYAVWQIPSRPSAQMSDKFFPVQNLNVFF